MHKFPKVLPFIQETLRWRPIVPLGAPHATTQEDEYRGLRIPAGATVLPNHWAMDLDDAVFDDPFALAPITVFDTGERYESDSSKMLQSALSGPVDLKASVSVRSSYRKEVIEELLALAEQDRAVFMPQAHGGDDADIKHGNFQMCGTQDYTMLHRE
ncbi:hypothetical protein ASPACDRAFT_47545 [Aspergillus aculeatus ATCC 16872]|uniref:Uncharacterized protein n=1 Tax=Aspergillus aculeatus (strain ATCC 16872 / CBS 172.66 / WB 5094) TaxID=690307 RepID=A0A1L9WHR8_ASPA1|nr:uncharacterized protein ASPACDRAFT_47545 [Aspergillus aculeatus ATCC 16872]OJJ95655.1 hypothetical protein ASPACDRAFT_47545 [Aspergillus aculeatus ATCC 16872]